MTATTLKVRASSPADQPTITMEREFDAPPDVLFRAFTEAEALKAWYGPNGFTITVLARDFRVGGLFRFTMHGPDGTDYPNRIAYREILPGERLAYRHGSDIDNDPKAFEVAVTFKALGAGPNAPDDAFYLPVCGSSKCRHEIRCGRTRHADAREAGCICEGITSARQRRRRSESIAGGAMLLKCETDDHRIWRRVCPYPLGSDDGIYRAVSGRCHRDVCRVARLANACNVPVRRAAGRLCRDLSSSRDRYAETVILRHIT